MKLFKNYRRLIAASVLITVTQTGCLCGIAFWPLWIAGSAIGVTGAAIVGGGIAHNHDRLIALGIELGLYGAILGEENPAHAEAFNEVPRDAKLAQKISVSLDDISDYNDNLNRIQVLGKQLVEDLKPLIKRIKNNEITPAMLTSDPQINQVAHRYGFGSAAEFMRTKNSATLPKAYVESFAQATDLSIPQAKIFLYHSFGIKTE